MDLNNEMAKSFLTLDSAVDEIEGIAKAINPFGGSFATTRYTHDGYSFDHHDLKQLITHFSKFMPIYEIDEIVSYVNRTASEAPLMIVELNIEKYRPSIQNLKTIDEIKRLKNTLDGYHKNLNELCDKQLHNLRSTALLKTNNLTEIESIVLESTPHTQIYELAIKKAAKIYRDDLAKFTNGEQADKYLDDIKNRGIRPSKDLGFKLFSTQLIEHLLLNELQSIKIETSSLEKISKMRDLADKYCIVSVSAQCEDIISILIKQNIRTADDQMFQNLYQYCPERLNKQFLSKWLSVTDDDSLNNLLIYREFSLNLAKNRHGAKKAMKKIVKMFENAGDHDNSFARLLAIMHYISSLEIDHNEKLRYIFDSEVEIQSMTVRIIDLTVVASLDDAKKIAEATDHNQAITSALAKACICLQPNVATIYSLSKYPFYFSIKDLIKLDYEIDEKIKSIFELEIALADSNDKLSLLYERTNYDSDHSTIVEIKQRIIEKAYTIKHQD